MIGFLARQRQLAALGVLLAGLLYGASAPCQADPDELARRHFESGAAYFEQAEYEEALTAFQKAYELSGRHPILRNISIVHERLGNLAEAIAALDEFLEKEPDGEGANTIRARRDNLKVRLEKEELAEPVEAAPVGEAQEQTDDETPAEQTKPRARQREKQGLPAEESNLLADEPNLAPAYILFSVGGLSAAGALLTGVVAQSEHDQLSESCKPTCTDSQVATGESLALTSTILTGVSVVSVAAGAIWWATAGNSEGPHGRQKSGPHVAVQVLPGVGYAEARFRF